MAIIGTVGLPAKYGGFETLVEHLVDHMSDDYDITVYCSSKNIINQSDKQSIKMRDWCIFLWKLMGYRAFLYDSWSIIHALFYADVLLILGVAGAWILPFIRLFTNKKSSYLSMASNGNETKWSRPAKWYLWWAENGSKIFAYRYF
ncbi:MAG: DUF1972 domain-containing protein [Saprospiraceae bacterium]|nr:DUF1972 domain-containing protein [Saprospiraceae bacterium]